MILTLRNVGQALKLAVRDARRVFLGRGSLHTLVLLFPLDMEEPVLS